MLLPKNSGINEGMGAEIAKLKDSFSGAEFAEFRAEDIPALVERLCAQGINAYGITGEDLLVEYALKNKGNLKIIKRIGWDDTSSIFGKPALCLLGPENKRLEDFNGLVRVGINKKYERLSENYVEKLRRGGLNVETIAFNGNTEQGVAQGMADLCIEIVCTGKQMKECGLAVYEKVFESGLVLIGAREKADGFDLNSLYEIIEKRKSENSGASFTRRLFDDKDFLQDKIAEESNELIEAAKENRRGKIVWETADVLYFVSVLLSANGIMLDEVWNELKRRNYENEKNKIKLG